jgi:hypothetical protein
MGYRNPVAEARYWRPRQGGSRSPRVSKGRLRLECQEHSGKHRASNHCGGTPGKHFSHIRSATSVLQLRTRAPG